MRKESKAYRILKIEEEMAVIRNTLSQIVKHIVSEKRHEETGPTISMLRLEDMPSSYLHRYYLDLHAFSRKYGGKTWTFEEFMKSEYPNVPMRDGRI